MSLTRRNFLHTSTSGLAIAAVGTVAPRPLHALLGRRPEVVPPIEDPRLKELSHRALNTAKSAGAMYADVRLRHERIRAVGPSPFPIDGESMHVAVRSLVNGYWGFAMSTVWSTEEIDRLARESVRQAKANVLGRTREMHWDPLPSVATGHWDMPIEIDPFSLHPNEITDYINGIGIFAKARLNQAGFNVEDIKADSQWIKYEESFASTEGSFFTQRKYCSGGAYQFTVENRSTERKDMFFLPSLLPAGMGWELFKGQPLREEIEQGIEESREFTTLPIKPVDVGRYDVALDALSTAKLLSPTIGAATELDRAMGYEANASGTSYLNDPEEMLGNMKVGNSLLTVHANRSEARGAATTRWDDEGVASSDFTLVKNGVLAEYSATREGAGWLKRSTHAGASSIQPRGCAVGGRDFIGGIYAPVVGTPNLTLTPGESTRGFDDCIREMGKGIAFRVMDFDMDFQQINGLGSGKAFEVKDGKRVAVIGGAGLLFRATELWKSLSIVGGKESAKRAGMLSLKGEPPQLLFHSVTAPPTVMKDTTIIDVLRKA